MRDIRLVWPCATWRIRYRDDVGRLRMVTTGTAVRAEADAVLRATEARLASGRVGAPLTLAAYSERWLTHVTHPISGRA